DDAVGSAGKGDLAAAAARLTRGLERYQAGDLVGALVEFEKALELYGPTRGKAFGEWVKSVQAAAATGKPAAIDAEALQAMNEALEEPPKSGVRPRPPQVLHQQEETRPERARKLVSPSQGWPELPPTSDGRTPPIPGGAAADKARPPTPMETAATMTLPQPPAANRKVTRDPVEGGESPWDPVPLTPGGSEAPAELRDGARKSERQKDPLAELQSQATKAAPPPVRPGSSATLHGMPALESKLLTPQHKKRNKVTEDRPESVTREFRSQTPTGQNLRPLDVPELTDEQIQSLLSLDSPLLPEGRTSPQLELDRIDTLDDAAPPSEAERMIEMEALPEPLPSRSSTTLKPLRKNDTNPMGVESYGEFDPNQLTPTGIKPAALKPVRDPGPEDDPYADLNLLPLEVAPDLSGPDEVEEGGTNPTNPFIRGTHASKLAQYTSHGSSAEVKLEDMPPLPSLPGTKRAAHPLGVAEAALQAGDLGAAVDACEAALAETGGLGGTVARDHLPLVEQIYGAMLGGADRVPKHGKAVGDLEPRSAFLLSRIDGAMTVEDVLDVSGMPRLEALRVMALLVRRGAVVIK
ncbi:MAG TPA: hypothetical protein VF334_24790, partial [Polyangia bacterium]